jgi:hypothetical protein
LLHLVILNLAGGPISATVARFSIVERYKLGWNKQFHGRPRALHAAQEQSAMPMIDRSVGS